MFLIVLPTACRSTRARWSSDHPRRPSRWKPVARAGGQTSKRKSRKKETHGSPVRATDRQRKTVGKVIVCLDC